MGESGKFAFEKALRGRDLTHAEFRILVLLVGYAGGDLDGAHPGTRRLAEDAGMGFNTVRRQLDSLEGKGWISVTGTYHSGHGRRGVAKVYALHVPNEQVPTQMGTGSAVDNSRPSAHPDGQLIKDDQVPKSDDQVPISDDQVPTAMGTHHVCTSDQYIRSGPAAESTSNDGQGDDQAHNGQAHPNGKEHKPSGASPRTELAIGGDESPVELRMKQLRNKGHAPVDAIRILLAERRTGEA